MKKKDRRKQMSNFNDMRGRVKSIAPCAIRFVEKKPDCWLYELLLFTKVRDDPRHVWVSVGDLTIMANCVQALELVILAK